MRIAALLGLLATFHLTDVAAQPDEPGEGTVEVMLSVDATGAVTDAVLVTSSGDAAADQRALREARKWKLRPATNDGVPVAAQKKVKITVVNEAQPTELKSSD